VIAAGTTFLAIVAPYVFGGEALRGFAFTMLVGIVAATDSTVFIASAIAIRLTGNPAGRKSWRRPTHPQSK
jgi:preprotein translocase subunit SecF